MATNPEAAGAVPVGVAIPTAATMASRRSGGDGDDGGDDGGDGSPRLPHWWLGLTRDLDAAGDACVGLVSAWMRETWGERLHQLHRQVHCAREDALRRPDHPSSPWSALARRTSLPLRLRAPMRAWRWRRCRSSILHEALNLLVAQVSGITSSCAEQLAAFTEAHAVLLLAPHLITHVADKPDARAMRRDLVSTVHAVLFSLAARVHQCCVQAVWPLCCQCRRGAQAAPSSNVVADSLDRAVHASHRRVLADLHARVVLCAKQRVTHALLLRVGAASLTSLAALASTNQATVRSNDADCVPLEVASLLSYWRQGTISVARSKRHAMLVVRTPVAASPVASVPVPGKRLLMAVSSVTCLALMPAGGDGTRRVLAALPHRRRLAVFRLARSQSDLILETVLTPPGANPYVRKPCKDLVAVLNQQQVVHASGRELYHWDVESGQCIRVFAQHPKDVLCLIRCPETQHLLTGSWDACIRTWDVQSGQEIVEERFTEGVQHHMVVYSLALSSAHLVSGSSRLIRVWCRRTHTVLRILGGHRFPVMSLAFLPCGLLVSGAFDAKVAVWSITEPTPRRVISLGVRRCFIVQLIVLSDTRVIIASPGFQNRDARVLDPLRGMLIHQLPGVSWPLLWLDLPLAGCYQSP